MSTAFVSSFWSDWLTTGFLGTLCFLNDKLKPALMPKKRGKTVNETSK
jgi:hypothetical protein